MQTPAIVTWQDVLPYMVFQVERIPAASWAGLLIGLLSFLSGLIVVWRTNAQHIRRLQLQLDAEDRRATRHLEHDSERQATELIHDADQRARERLTSMRRDVYAEAIAQAGNFARALVSLSKPPVVLDAHYAFRAAMDRLILLCDAGSKELATSVRDRYSDAAVQCLAVLGPVRTGQIDAKQPGKQMRLLTSARDEIFARHKALLENTKPGEIETIKASSEMLRARIDELSGEILKANEERQALRQASLQQRVKAVDGIKTLLRPPSEGLEQLIHRLRVELGVDKP